MMVENIDTTVPTTATLLTVAGGVRAMGYSVRRRRSRLL